MANIKKSKNFEHIGTILPKILSTCRPGRDTALSAVWHLWDDAVGEIIAANAQPAAFKKNLLLVHVSNPTWIHQLQFLKKDIIAKLNQSLGEKRIKDLKFKVGPL